MGHAGGARQMGLARPHRGGRGLSGIGWRRGHHGRSDSGVRDGITMHRTLALLLCAALSSAAFQSGVEAIFTPLFDAKSPGAAVLVIKNGRTFFERGYGVRDLRSMAKIGSSTDFRLASFSKQFTAMAIMLLVHDQQLRYEDRLTDLFPGFPEYGRAITIRHLLTHTSGLPAYED